MDPISCQSVYLEFRSSKGRVPVLANVSLEITPGELHCVIGPSGCGKSTLLNLVAGLLTQTRGEIRVGNRATGNGITPKVAYMTQKDTLLPWFTNRKNVELPMMAIGRRHGTRAAADELLELVGLTGFEDYYPHELSGGMRKRVHLARTLAQEPSVLLMDEPFGALDYQTKVLIHERFLRIWEARRHTVMFVTHDLNEAIALADRITIMTKRPASVKGQCRVDIPRPRTMDTLVGTDAYQALYHTIWDQLRAEITDTSANGSVESSPIKGTR
jgi:NitT/TauT family transport system ATP-binding protein